MVPLQEALDLSLNALSSFSDRGPLARVGLSPANHPAIYALPSKEQLAVPTKQLLAALTRKCSEWNMSSATRLLRAHMPQEDDELPQECDCCSFGRDRNKVRAEWDASFFALTSRSEVKRVSFKLYSNTKPIYRCGNMECTAC